MQAGGGSDEKYQPSSWAGAVTPKPPLNAMQNVTDRPTDGQGRNFEDDTDLLFLSGFPVWAKLDSG